MLDFIMARKLTWDVALYKDNPINCLDDLDL